MAIAQRLRETDPSTAALVLREVADSTIPEFDATAADVLHLPIAQAVLEGHERALRAAVFSPDGRTVLTSSQDKTARVWNADGSGEPIVLRGHQDWVYGAVFSPDGHKVLTRSADKTARVWNADGSGEPIVLRGHENYVTSAVFSPDGRKVLTSSADGTARVWLADPEALRGGLWAATPVCLSVARRQSLLGETPLVAAEGLRHCRAKVAQRLGQHFAQ